MTGLGQREANHAFGQIHIFAFEPDKVANPLAGRHGGQNQAAHLAFGGGEHPGALRRVEWFRVGSNPLAASQFLRMASMRPKRCPTEHAQQVVDLFRTEF